MAKQMVMLKTRPPFEIEYMATLPAIVADYMESTGQFSEADRLGIVLSEGHVLEEAEWCLYNAYENEASGAYEYHHMQKKALRRFVENMQKRGVVPKHDFEI